MHIVFSCSAAMVEKKAKAGKRRNDSGSSEEDVEESSNNNCGISLYLTGLNMAFRHLKNIYQENFGQQSLI